MKLLLNLALRFAAVAVPCWIVSGGHPAAFVGLLAAPAVAFSAYAFVRVAVF